MSVIRAFIAIDLTPEITQHLDEVITQFKQQLKGVPIRWVPADNIHLTLKFLGDVSLNNIELLQEMLKTEVAGHRPFEISVGGLGAFPTVRRPRVIWTGVEAPPELQLVQAGIENEMERLGYARENRPFSPHLTLGRISRNANSKDVREVAGVLGSTKIGFLGAACVREIYLYRSELRPQGATYTRLFTALLNQESQ